MFDNYRYNRLRRLGTVDGRFSTDNLNNQEEAAYVNLATAKWIRERTPAKFGLDITGFPKEEVQRLWDLMQSNPDPGTPMTKPHIVEYKKFGKKYRVFIDGVVTGDVPDDELYRKAIEKNAWIREVEEKYRALGLEVQFGETEDDKIFCDATYVKDGVTYKWTYPDFVDRAFHDKDPAFVRRLYWAKAANAAEHDQFRKQTIANS